MDEHRVKAFQEWYFGRYEKIYVAEWEEHKTFDFCFLCPCCGFPTLAKRLIYDVCILCGWEDDGQDDPDADEVWGGPNSDYSLAEARRNFAQYSTYRRPADKPYFEMDTAISWSGKPLDQVAIKKRLMAMYDELIACQDATRREEFWREIKSFTDAFNAQKHDLP